MDGGDIYVSDTANHAIRKIVVATAAVSTLAGTPVQGAEDGIGSAAHFYYPDGMVADGAGNLFVADSFNHNIRKIVIPTGTVTTFAGSAAQAGNRDGTGKAARFDDPSGLAVDGAGNLYVADFGNRNIRKIVLATGVVTTLIEAPVEFRSVRHMTYGSGSLYVANDQTVLKVSLATRNLSTALGSLDAGHKGVFAALGSGGLNQAQGVAWVPGLGLAITDTTENVVLFARGL